MASVIKTDLRMICVIDLDTEVLIINYAKLVTDLVCLHLINNKRNFARFLQDLYDASCERSLFQ